MKENSIKKHWFIFTGSSLILTGVLLNEWIVAALFSPDGVLSTPLYRIIIWIFNVSLVSIGALLLIYRESLVENIKMFLLPMIHKYLKASVKAILFPFITLIMVTVILEIGLQLLTVIFPKIDLLLSNPSEIPRTISVQRLGHRPNPVYPGHDRNGFRNISVPEKAEIVAIGDSQTYGTKVKRYQAWPQQLQKFGKIKVYNMSFGGYGPVHSSILLDEALKFEPKLVIEAFYSGNDLYDSYQLVYAKNQLPEMKTSDEKVIKDILEADNIESLWDRAHRDETKKSKQKQTPDTKNFSSVAKDLFKKCKLYRIFSTVKRLYNDYRNPSFDWEHEKMHAMENETYLLPFENEEFRTIFTPDRRFCALDFNDVRIIEGHRLSLEAIRLMSKRTKKENIDFKVLLIPTKELVFKNVVYETQESPRDDYKTLIDSEELFWRRTKTYLENQGIDYIDSLPALRSCLSSGVQPYRISKDGHPNPVGHQAIAELVLSTLREHTDLK